MTAKTAKQAAPQKKPERRLVLVRLETEAEELDTHDLFIQCEDEEETRRQAMIIQLKERVAHGTYVPNLDLIAERMLTDR